jgi:uncharacterized protein
MALKKPKSKFRYWLNLISVGLIFGIFLYFAMIVFSIVRPAPSDLGGITPRDWGFEYQDASIQMDDGAFLKGWYIPGNNDRTVILIHGYGSNRLQMGWRAQVLAQKGYGIFMYDLRASGESSGKLRSWGWQDVDDLKNVLTYLHEKYQVPENSIDLVGASTGGEIAILAKERYPEIQKVVADGAGYSVASDLPPNLSFGDRIGTAPVNLILKTVEVVTGVHPKSSIVSALRGMNPHDVLLISTGTGPEKLTADYYCSILGSECYQFNVPNANHTLAYQAEPELYGLNMLDFLSD